MKFEDLIEIYEDEEKFRTNSGVLLIHKLDGEGELGYVHTIFPPEENSFRIIRGLSGFDPPNEYALWMKKYGGASMFYRSLVIYGVNKIPSRDVDIELLAPVPIETELINANYIQGDDLPVAGISLYSKSYDLKLSRSGSATLSLGREIAFFSDFENCLDLILEILYNNFRNSDYSDNNYLSAESDIDSILRKYN